MNGQLMRFHYTAIFHDSPDSDNDEINLTKNVITPYFTAKSKPVKDTYSLKEVEEAVCASAHAGFQ